MMDAIVQLIRNALCCVKDWEMFSDSIPMLYDPRFTNEWLRSYLSVELPDYVNKTTPLELVISVTQLYACISCAKSGTTLAWTSAGKLKRVVRLLEGRLSASPGPDASPNTLAAHRIVNESLVKEAKSAMRNTFVGLLVAPIGFAFFWLFANSWHVTEAGWIGGLVALIDALTVMELCLIPLLYYMVVDGLAQFRIKKQTEECIGVVSSGTAFNPDYVNVTRYEFMEPGWVPFYEGGIGALAPAKEDEERNTLAKETKRVEQTLDLWFAPSAATTKDDSKEKDAKIRREAIDNALATMKGSLNELSVKGYREFVYLVLNFIAFYGYLMAIVGFYYPDDDFQPNWIKSMKFGYDNNFADWSGNFAGDLMWTIEPMVILASPYYIASLQSNETTKAAPAKAKTE
eukprot:jgi/Psemu1/290146/fgenesh1_pg.452_\